MLSPGSALNDALARGVSLLRELGAAQYAIRKPRYDVREDDYSDALATYDDSEYDPALDYNPDDPENWTDDPALMPSGSSTGADNNLPAIVYALAAGMPVTAWGPASKDPRMGELAKRAGRQFEQRAMALMAQYGAGKITLDQAFAGIKAAYAQQSTNAFVAGKRAMGDLGSLGNLDYQTISGLVENDTQGIDALQASVAGGVAGGLLSGVMGGFNELQNLQGVQQAWDFVSGKIGMSGNQVENYDSAGEAAALGDLPNETVMVWWTLGDADHCEDCIALSDASPMLLSVLDEQGLFPGSGHTQCLIPGTEVAGTFTGGYRMRYQGQVVQIETAGGRRLTITPNHPVLTPAGFTPAGVLREGDELICYAGQIEEPGGMGGNEAVYEHDRPAPIEQVLRALAALPSTFTAQSSRAPEDLHGDARFGQGDIEVVRPLSELLHKDHAAGCQQAGEFVLVSPTQRERSFGSERAPSSLLDPYASTTHRHVGGPEQTESILSTELAHTHLLTLGTVSYLDARLDEPAGESRAADMKLLRKLQEAEPEFIAADRIVKVERLDYDGHVYDLSTGRVGWYLANDAIVANCGSRCYCSFEYDIPTEVCGDGFAGEDPSMSLLESADGSRFNVWVQEAASCDLPIDLSSMNTDGEFDVIDDASAFSWDEEATASMTGDLQEVVPLEQSEGLLRQLYDAMKGMMPNVAPDLRASEFANETSTFHAVWHETPTSVWFDAGLTTKGPTALEPEFVLKSLHQMSDYAATQGKDLVINGATAGPGMGKWLDTLGADHSILGAAPPSVTVKWPTDWKMPEVPPSLTGLPPLTLENMVAAAKLAGTTKAQQAMVDWFDFENASAMKDVSKGLSLEHFSTTGGDYLTKAEQKKLVEQSGLIQQIAAGSRVPETTLYRGQAFASLDDMKAAFPEGSPKLIDSLTAVSPDLAWVQMYKSVEYVGGEEGAVSATIVIKDPAGIRGIQRPVMIHGVDEGHEVIMPKDAPYRVASVEKVGIGHQTIFGSTMDVPDYRITLEAVAEPEAALAAPAFEAAKPLPEYAWPKHPELLVPESSAVYVTPDGATSFFVKHEGHYEVNRDAAIGSANILRSIGLDTPPVSEQTLKWGPDLAKTKVSIQPMYADAMGLDEMGTTEKAAIAALSAAQVADVTRLEIGNWLVGETDNNLSNFMVKADGRVVSVDHAASLRPPSELKVYGPAIVFGGDADTPTRYLMDKPTTYLARIHPDDLTSTLAAIDQMSDAELLKLAGGAADDPQVAAILKLRRAAANDQWSAFFGDLVDKAGSKAPPEWKVWKAEGSTLLPKLPEAEVKIPVPVGPPKAADDAFLKDGLKPGKDPQMYLAGDSPVPINAPLTAWSGFVPPEPELPPLEAPKDVLAAAKADAQAAQHTTAGFLANQYDYLVSDSKATTDELVAAGHVYEKLGDLRIVAKDDATLQVLKDYLAVSGQRSTDEAFWTLLGYSREDLAKVHYYDAIKGGYSLRAGAVIVEPDGRTWVLEPKNHFAGYSHTWAKGGVDTGESTAQAAVREIREELGFSVELDAHLGDYINTDKTALSRMYVAHRTGGGPLMGDLHETYKVKLVTPEQAAKLLNRYGKPDIRDQQILGDAVKALNGAPGTTHYVLPAKDLTEFNAKVMPLKDAIAVPDLPAVSHDPELFNVAPVATTPASHAESFAYDGNWVTGAQGTETTSPASSTKFPYNTTKWPVAAGQTQAMYWKSEADGTRLFWANSKVQIENPVTRLNVHVAQLVKFADQLTFYPAIGALRVNDTLLDQVPKLREMLVAAGATKPTALTTELSREQLRDLVTAIKGGAFPKPDAFIPTAPLVPVAKTVTEAYGIDGEALTGILKGPIFAPPVADDLQAKVLWTLPGTNTTAQTSWLITTPPGKPASLILLVGAAPAETQVAVLAAQMARIAKVAEDAGVEEVRVLSYGGTTLSTKTTDFLKALGGDQPTTGAYAAWILDSEALGKVRQDILGLDPELVKGLTHEVPIAAQVGTAQSALAATYGLDGSVVAGATSGGLRNAIIDGESGWRQSWEFAGVKSEYGWHVEDNALILREAKSPILATALRQIADLGDLAELMDYERLTVPKAIWSNIPQLKTILTTETVTGGKYGAITIEKADLLALRDKITAAFDYTPKLEPTWAPGPLAEHLGIDPQAFALAKATSLEVPTPGATWFFPSAEHQMGSVHPMGFNGQLVKFNPPGALTVDAMKATEGQLQIIRWAVENSSAGDLWVGGVPLTADVKNVLLAAGGQVKASMVVITRDQWAGIEKALTTVPEPSVVPTISSKAVRAIASTQAEAENVGVLALAKDFIDHNVASTYGQNMKETLYGPAGFIRWRRLGNVLEIHSLVSAEDEAQLAHILRMAAAMDEAPKIEGLRLTNDAYLTGDIHLIGMMKEAGGTVYPGGLRLTREQTLNLRDAIVNDLKATAAEPLPVLQQVLIPKYDLDPFGDALQFTHNLEAQKQGFWKSSWFNPADTGVPVDIVYRRLQTELYWARITGNASLIDRQVGVTREFLRMADDLAANPGRERIRFAQLDKLPAGFLKMLKESGAEVLKNGDELALPTSKVLALADVLKSELGMEHVEAVFSAVTAPLSTAETIWTEAGASAEEASKIKISLSAQLSQYDLWRVGDNGEFSSMWEPSNKWYTVGSDMGFTTPTEQLAVMMSVIGSMPADTKMISLGWSVTSDIQPFLKAHGMTDMGLPADAAKKLLADLKAGVPALVEAPGVPTEAAKLSTQLDFSPIHLADVELGPNTLTVGGGGYFDYMPTFGGGYGGVGHISGHMLIDEYGWSLDAVSQSSVTHGTATLYGLMVLDQQLAEMGWTAQGWVATAILQDAVKDALISGGGKVAGGGAYIALTKNDLHLFVLKVEADAGIKAPLLGSAASGLVEHVAPDLPSVLLQGYGQPLYDQLAHFLTTGPIGDAVSTLHIGHEAATAQMITSDLFVVLGKLEVIDPAVLGEPIPYAMAALFGGSVKAMSLDLDLRIGSEMLAGPGGEAIKELALAYHGQLGVHGDILLDHKDVQALAKAISSDAGMTAKVEAVAAGIPVPGVDEITSLYDNAESGVMSMIYTTPNGNTLTVPYTSESSMWPHAGTLQTDIAGIGGADDLQHVALADIYGDSKWAANASDLSVASWKGYSPAYLQAAGPQVAALLHSAGGQMIGENLVLDGPAILKVHDMIVTGQIPEHYAAATQAVSRAQKLSSDELVAKVKELASTGYSAVAPSGGGGMVYSGITSNYKYDDSLGGYTQSKLWHSGAGAEPSVSEYAAAALADLYHDSNAMHPQGYAKEWLDQAGSRVKALMIDAGGSETATGAVEMSPGAMKSMKLKIDSGNLQVAGPALPGHVLSSLGIDPASVGGIVASQTQTISQQVRLVSFKIDATGTTGAFAQVRYKDLKTSIMMQKYGWGSYGLEPERVAGIMRHFAKLAAESNRGLFVDSHIITPKNGLAGDFLKAFGYKAGPDGGYNLTKKEAKSLFSQIEAELHGAGAVEAPASFIAASQAAQMAAAVPSLATKYGWDKETVLWLEGEGGGAAPVTKVLTTNASGNVYETKTGYGTIRWAEEKQGAAAVLRIRDITGEPISSMSQSSMLTYALQAIIPDHMQANVQFDRVFIDRKVLANIPQYEQFLKDSGWKETKDYYMLKQPEALKLSVNLSTDTAPWLTTATIPSVTAAVPVTAAQTAAASAAEHALKGEVFDPISGGWSVPASPATAAVTGSVTLPSTANLKPSFLYAFDKGAQDQGYGKLVGSDLGKNAEGVSLQRLTTPDGLSTDWSVSSSGKAIGWTALTLPPGGAPDQAYASLRKVLEEVQARPNVSMWFVTPSVYEQVPGLRQLLNDAGGNETDFAKMGHAIQLKTDSAPKILAALQTDTMGALKVSVTEASEYLEYNAQLAGLAVVSAPQVAGEKVTWTIGSKPVSMKVQVTGTEARWRDISAGEKANWGVATAAQLAWFSDQGMEKVIVDQAVLLRVPKLAQFLMASGGKVGPKGVITLDLKSVNTAAKMVVKNALPEALGGAKMAYSIVDEMATKMPDVIAAAQSEVVAKQGLMQATKYTMTSGAQATMVWTKSPVNLYWREANPGAVMSAGEKRAAAVTQLRSLLQTAYGDAGIARLDVDMKVIDAVPGMREVLTKYGATVERNPDGSQYLSMARAKATKLHGDLEKELGPSFAPKMGASYIQEQAALIAWPDASALTVTQADARGALGGQTRKMILTDSKGDQWLFKPGATGRGAAVDTSVAKLAERLGLSVPPVREYSVTVEGAVVHGSLQKMLPGVKAVTSLAALSPSQIAEVMQHSVLDWLTANDDGHIGQWLIGPDGHVWGIDKSRSWVTFHQAQDVLDRASMGNGGGKPLMFEFFKQATANPKLLEAIHPSTFTNILRKIDTLDNAEYSRIVESAAQMSEQARYARDPAKYLADMVERKQSTAADFDRFVSKQVKDAIALHPTSVPKEWSDWLAKGGHFDLSSTPKDLWLGRLDELNQRFGEYTASAFTAKQNDAHFRPLVSILQSFYGGGVSGSGSGHWGGELLRDRLVASGHAELVPEWEALQQWGLLSIMSGKAAPTSVAATWRKYWNPETGSFRVVRTAYHSQLDQNPAAYADYYTKTGFRSLVSSALGTIVHVGAPSGRSIAIWADVPYTQAWATYVLGLGAGAGESELVIADLRIDQVIAFTKDTSPIPFDGLMAYNGPVVK